MIWLRVLTASLVMIIPGLGQSPEIRVELEAGKTEVEFGAPFDLLIRKAWTAEAVPTALDLSQLSSLQPELVSQKQSNAEGYFREETRLRCLALALDRLEIPAMAFSLQLDGKEILLRSEPIEIAVTSLLPENDIGKAAELPPEMPAAWKKEDSTSLSLELVLWIAFSLSLCLFLWQWRQQKSWSMRTLVPQSPEDRFQERMNDLAHASFQRGHFESAAFALKDLLVAGGQMPRGALTLSPETKSSLGTELSTGIEDLLQKLYFHSYCPELAGPDVFSALLDDCRNKGRLLIEESAKAGGHG